MLAYSHNQSWAGRHCQRNSFGNTGRVNKYILELDGLIEFFHMPGELHLIVAMAILGPGVDLKVILNGELMTDFGSKTIHGGFGPVLGALEGELSSSPEGPGDHLLVNVETLILQFHFFINCTNFFTLKECMHKLRKMYAHLSSYIKHKQGRS